MRTLNRGCGDRHGIALLRTETVKKQSLVCSGQMILQRHPGINSTFILAPGRLP